MQNNLVQQNSISIAKQQKNPIASTYAQQFEGHEVGRLQGYKQNPYIDNVNQNNYNRNSNTGIQHEYSQFDKDDPSKAYLRQPRHQNQNGQSHGSNNRDYSAQPNQQQSRRQQQQRGNSVQRFPQQQNDQQQYRPNWQQRNNSPFIGNKNIYLPIRKDVQFYNEQRDEVCFLDIKPEMIYWLLYTKQFEKMEREISIKIRFDQSYGFVIEEGSMQAKQKAKQQLERLANEEWKMIVLDQTDQYPNNFYTTYYKMIEYEEYKQLTKMNILVITKHKLQKLQEQYELKLGYKQNIEGLPRHFILAWVPIQNEQEVVAEIKHIVTNIKYHCNPVYTIVDTQKGQKQVDNEQLSQQNQQQFQNQREQHDQFIEQQNQNRDYIFQEPDKEIKNHSDNETNTSDHQMTINKTKETGSIQTRISKYKLSNQTNSQDGLIFSFFNREIDETLHGFQFDQQDFDQYLSTNYQLPHLIQPEQNDKLTFIVQYVCSDNISQDKMHITKILEEYMNSQFLLVSDNCPSLHHVSNQLQNLSDQYNCQINIMGTNYSPLNQVLYQQNEKTFKEILQLKIEQNSQPNQLIHVKCLGHHLIDDLKSKLQDIIEHCQQFEILQSQDQPLVNLKTEESYILSYFYFSILLCFREDLEQSESNLARSFAIMDSSVLDLTNRSGIRAYGFSITPHIDKTTKYENFQVEKVMVLPTKKKDIEEIIFVILRANEDEIVKIASEFKKIGIQKIQEVFKQQALNIKETKNGEFQIQIWEDSMRYYIELRKQQIENFKRIVSLDYQQYTEDVTVEEHEFIIPIKLAGYNELKGIIQKISKNWIGINKLFKL